eukprot:3743257-Pyramimonas_sp.AAC.1
MPRNEWNHINKLLSIGGKSRGPSSPSNATPFMTNEGVSGPTKRPDGSVGHLILSTRGQVAQNKQRHFCKAERGLDTCLSGTLQTYKQLPDLLSSNDQHLL